MKGILSEGTEDEETWTKAQWGFVGGDLVKAGPHLGPVVPLGLQGRPHAHIRM